MKKIICIDKELLEQTITRYFKTWSSSINTSLVTSQLVKDIEHAALAQTEPYKEGV